MKKKKFETGLIFATSNALANVSKEHIMECLEKHQRCDWGTIDEYDRMANDRGLNPKTPDRLISAYTYPDYRIYIITESDRSSTTLLLTEDY